MKWILSGFFFLVLATPVFAQEFNAGFVQGLWYDKDDVFVGGTVRIYVAIRNNTGAELTGTVEFFDNGIRIERKNVSALDGRIIESWADWNPTFGEHSITATLSRTEIHKVGSSSQGVGLNSALAENIVFVDLDTDNDKIGNEKDADDDNDGISDEDEDKNGTDPLVPDNDENDSDENQDETADEIFAVEDNNPDNPEGLEQYLSSGNTDSALSSITETINNSKRKIDEYREKRNSNNSGQSSIQVKEPAIISQIKPASLETASLDASNTESFSNGFGEVTREADKDKGFFASAFGLIGTLISSLFTLSLYLLSILLGHPAIVQLALLFFILFTIYKFAKRLGQRDNY